MVSRRSVLGWLRTPVVASALTAGAVSGSAAALAAKRRDDPPGPADKQDRVFAVPRRRASASVADRFAVRIDVKNDFGAVGDNIVLDHQAINAAVEASANSGFPIPLFFAPGVYRCSGPINNLGKPIVMFGDADRSAVLNFEDGVSGSYDCLTFSGRKQRVPGCGIRNMVLQATGMTGGHMLNVDWVQGFLAEGVTFAGAHNWMSLRQAGETRFSNCIVDRFRGDYGLLAQASNRARNGENDQIDVIDIGSNLTISGTYVPGGGRMSDANAVILDGRVHTLTGGALRLVAAGRGVLARNSFGLPQKFVPSFLNVDSIETENTWREGLRFEALNGCKSKIFTATSVSESGIYLGRAARMIHLQDVESQGHWKHGIDIDGASDVTISPLGIFRNGGAGPRVYSGIRIAANSESICVIGGHVGTPRGEVPFENGQAFGIKNEGGPRVRSIGVDLTGNSVSPISGPISSI